MPFNIDNSAIFSNKKKFNADRPSSRGTFFFLQEYSGKIGPPSLARSHEPCNYMSIFLGHFS